MKEEADAHRFPEAGGVAVQEAPGWLRRQQEEEGRTWPIAFLGFSQQGIDEAGQVS